MQIAAEHMYLLQCQIKDCKCCYFCVAAACTDVLVFVGSDVKACDKTLACAVQDLERICLLVQGLERDFRRP